MSESGASEWIRWVVALPLASAAILGIATGVVRRPLPVFASRVLSCSSLGLAFLMCFGLLLQLVALDSPQPALVDDMFTWIGAGRFQVEAALLFDPLSATAALLGTGVAFLISLHAGATLSLDTREEGGLDRLLCTLDLATASFLLLVLAENLVLFFAGWQLLGLCLHLLVGFWYLDARAARGATRVFGAQLIADVALALALLLWFWSSLATGGSGLGFRELAAAVPALQERTLGTPVVWSALPGMAALGARWSVANLLAACLVVAAACRAAQLPFQFWSRDTARAPVPALALVLTTAGLPASVFLLCRFDALLRSALEVSQALAWIGAATALLASAAALAQREARRVLVYVALVQLGLMFLAVGLGASSSALFHLVTQAVSLTAMFLCLATISRALGLAPHRDLVAPAVGALWHSLPRTHLVFVCGWAATVGIPFTAGFFSRDQIFLAVGQVDWFGQPALQLMALLAQGGVAFSITRLWLSLFHGSPGRADLPGTERERGLALMLPLATLGFLALFIGWLGPSGALNPFPVGDAESNSLANFLAPVVPSVDFGVSHGVERRLAFLLAGLSCGFALLAWRTPDVPLLAATRARLGSSARAATPAVRRILRGLFETPQLMRHLVRPALRQADRFLLRGLEARIASGGGLTAPARFLRTGIDASLRPLQSGRPQTYLFVMLVGTLAMLAWLLP